MGERQELPIPPSSLASERAVEILRIWINADKSMDASLIPTFYETGYWGAIIIDLMQRLGEAYEAQGGLKKEEVVESIYSVVVNNFDARSKLRAEQLAKIGSTMPVAPTPKRK